MNQVELQAEKREKVGSANSRKLRREGRLPASLYGHGGESFGLHIDGKAYRDAMRHGAMLVNLRFDGGNESAVVHDVQYDTLSQEPIHVDFLRVNLLEKVEVEVSLKLHGPAKGEEEGGIIVEQMNAVTILCLPTSIPEFLEVDIRSLGIKDSLHVSDLKLPEGVEATDEPDRVILTIVEPRFTEEEKPEDAAEPEVIGKPAEPGEGKDS